MPAKQSTPHTGNTGVGGVGGVGGGVEGSSLKSSATSCDWTKLPVNFVATLLKHLSTLNFEATTVAIRSDNTAKHTYAPLTWLLLSVFEEKKKKKKKHDEHLYMADSGVPIASIQTLELELPPSCIEFCIAHPCYFVVGTYNLQKEEEGEALSGVGDGSPKAEADRDGSSNSPDVVKKPQSRNGSLVVFQVIDRQV